MLTAPLWVPDSIRGNGKVVQYLQLRNPLNSTQHSSQTWPLTNPKSTGATFDFAVSNAPASFFAGAGAVSSSMRNHALPPTNMQDSAHASSLVVLRASAMLLVLCGDFRKELNWTEGNTGGASCFCCSNWHSSNQSNIDARLTSIFPAVSAALFRKRTKMVLTLNLFMKYV